MKKMMAVVALVVASAIVLPMNADAAVPTNASILVGKTCRTFYGNYVTFGGNGSYTYRRGDGSRVDRGRYTINGSQIYVRYDNGKSRLMSISKEGSQIFFNGFEAKC